MWLLCVGLTLLLLGTAVAVAGGATVARHRAQHAADLGALAGAGHGFAGVEVACAEARRVVSANQAVMVGCRLDRLDLTVTVEVAAPAGLGVARAAARAGPLRTG